MEKSMPKEKETNSKKIKKVLDKQVSLEYNRPIKNGIGN